MTNFTEKINSIFNSHLAELKTINEFLYHNPELGHQEFKACKILTDSLKKHGFEVTSNFCNLPTAFLGKYKKGNKNIKIAILTEYDALPEIGHGCGHNAFAITSLATGIILKEILETSSIEGEILVIGTPAEESSGAKVDMANLGVFDDVDIAMAAHPTGKQHMLSGSSQAMEALKFTFKGKTAHAASKPYEGINALDGVINLFNSINALRQQIKEEARIHGIISNGGEVPNIIPDIAVANFYVRTNCISYLKELVTKVKNCAYGAALASGTELIIENYETSFANLITNQSLSKIYEKNLRSLGVEEMIVDEGYGSTDMGDVSHCCPTIHPFFPLCKRHLVGHSVELAKSTIEEEAYIGIKESCFAMVLTALDILQDSNLLLEIKEEFNSTK